MKIVNLSCIVFMYLVICCKKCPVFYENRRMEKIYREGSGRLLRWPNNFLHESLLLLPVIILIIFFCILKTLALCVEFPQNVNPYKIIV